MQFLSENHPNGCQIFFGRFGFLKTESEPNFGFPHISTSELLTDCYVCFSSSLLRQFC